MIESVQERQKGAFDFGQFYENLCALQDSCPVPAVKAHLHEGVLDINGDRIRVADWEPILNSITINKNLRFIGVRSYFQLKVDEKTSERRAAILKSRIPVIRGKEMTLRLCKSLKSCLDTTENLSFIELQGLPLREKDLSILVKGLVKNGSLKHLSLEFCRIGDFGVQIVCQALKHAGNVNTLNLTGCSLSSSGMEAIAELIKYQAMSRHNEAWKESLRYRRPNLDSMSGVRRITLNCNPLIDNRGATVISEAVKDDLWVKAIDLQQCGIGNVGAKAFLKVLMYNNTLVVLDLRQNPLIDRDILRTVTEQVLVNANGKDSEYRWLRVDTEKSSDASPNGKDRNAVKFGNRPGSATRRPAFRPGGVAHHSRYVEFPRTSPHGKALAHHNGEEESDGRSSRGLPWRTAARASRYKGYPPDHVPGKTHLEERSEASNDVSSVPNSARTDEEVETVEDESSVVSPLVHEFEHSPPPAGTLKELRIQVMHLRRTMNEEAKARRKAEEKMMELMMENQRLKRDLDHRAAMEERGGLNPRLMVGGGGSLHDEKILRNIEQSFQQFHAFLDLLRDAGLGRVVTAAGMDQLPHMRQTVPQQEPIVYRDDEVHNDIGIPSRALLDPVEQSYRSAAHARSEADKLYLRLKEATSREGSSEATRCLPTATVFPARERNAEKAQSDAEDRTWTREQPPADGANPEPSTPSEKEMEEVERDEPRYEDLPVTGEGGEGITAAVDALISGDGDQEDMIQEDLREEGEFQGEEANESRKSTPRMERSKRVSSDEEEDDNAAKSDVRTNTFNVGDSEENPVSAGYNSDTFEVSEGSRFGRSTEDFGRNKASLDNVEEIDLEDF